MRAEIRPTPPPRVWLTTRCPDCGVLLEVYESSAPDAVIARHIAKDCRRHDHPKKPDRPKKRRDDRAPR